MNLKKTIILILTAALAVLAVSVICSASESETVTYYAPVYWTEDNVASAHYGIHHWEAGTVVDYTAVTSGDSGRPEFSDGVYVFKGDVTYSQGASIRGQVTFILLDGCDVTFRAGTDDQAALEVAGTSSLTVFCQSQDDSMGKLTAEAKNCGAGIGGDNGEDSGSIVISGGNITATAVRGAGIGGGMGGSGKSIVIDAGTINAVSEEYGAAIGGGCFGNGIDITINSGRVNASAEHGAAIGGGGYDGALTTSVGSGSGILLNGGVITARSRGGAGIGGGNMGNAYDITVKGGTIYAYGAIRGIGEGEGGSSKNITVAARLNLFSGSGEQPEKQVLKNRKSETDLVSEKDFQNESIVIMDYLNHVTTLIEGLTLEMTEYNVKGNPASGVKEVTTKQAGACTPLQYGTASTLTEGWYVVNSDVTLYPLTLDGEVYLLLADGCTLTINADSPDESPFCVPDGSSLCIYGQSAGTGKLILNALDNGAALGGSGGEDAGIITIYGGTIEATAQNGAGIGGGVDGSGGTIEIYGGTISAVSENGAGIGTGVGGSTVNVSIKGGNVTATSRGDGAGVGTGREGRSYGVVLVSQMNGGDLIATAEGAGAGIGSGVNSYQKQGDLLTLFFETGTAVAKSKGGNAIDTLDGVVRLVGQMTAKDAEGRVAESVTDSQGLILRYLSDYIIVDEKPVKGADSSKTLTYIIIGAAIVLLCGAFFVVRRKKAEKNTR